MALRIAYVTSGMGHTGTAICQALHRAGRTLLSDKPVASFEGYGKKGTIAPFDLHVRPGEIVGLAGLLGSGRTETAEVIFGIHPADSGQATIKGKPQTLRSPGRRPDAAIAEFAVCL